jgi:hypothetical protein
MQDDLTKFVSEPTSPPRLVEITEEGKGNGKDRREVGEGDDTITIEDTSDEEVGETLKERFQLRSRFIGLGCPISLLSKTLRLAWRLVSLRRRGGRAMWHASALPRN